MWTSVNRILLFWTAFILTRPLAAAVGDFLDKPLDHGGLAFSHPIASAVLGAAILLLILLLPQRAGRKLPMPCQGVGVPSTFHGEYRVAVRNLAELPPLVCYKLPMSLPFRQRASEGNAMANYKVGYIVGSLATGSINRKLAYALSKLAPPVWN